MSKIQKTNIVIEQVQAFSRLMFHDIRDIRQVLTPALNRRMIFLRTLMLAVAVLETLTIYVIAFFSASISAPEQVKNLFFLRPIFELFPRLASWCSDDRNFILFMSLFIVFFILIKNILTALSHWQTAVFSEQVSSEVSDEIMRRFLYSPYRWHLSSQSGRIFQVMGWRGNLTAMISSLLNVQSYVITTAFLFIGLTCAAPALTLSVYLFMGGAGLLTYKLIRKSVDTAGANSAAASARENAAIVNALRGIREVLIYRQQPVFLKAVSDSAQAGSRPRAYLAIASTIPTWVLEVCGFAIISAAIAVLVKFWHAGIADITKIVILLMLTAWRALPALNKVVNLMVSIRAHKPFSSQCLEVLQSLRTNIMEIPPPPDMNFSFSREISLKQASFCYPGSSQDCLSGVSLTIKKGSLVGFVGPSGVGKTTLITILSGLLSPTAGEMLVDGKRLSPEEHAAYCLRVGYVPQNPYLMAGTIAENVAFSEWGKPYDESRVMQACQKAAVDFISPGRGGICMRLGENGTGLSGGQAQRVAIARALYANPDIVIFDEATSSLDQANEKAIQDTVLSLRKKTTCIVVAHRLSTVEVCDYLFWLDQGQLIGQGTPSELLPLYTTAMKKVPAGS